MCLEHIFLLGIPENILKKVIFHQHNYIVGCQFTLLITQFCLLFLSPNIYSHFFIILKVHGLYILQLHGIIVCIVKPSSLTEFQDGNNNQFTDVKS